MEEKKIYIEFNGKQILLEDIQGIAFEIHDSDVSKYIRSNHQPVEDRNVPNGYQISNKKIDIPFYSDDFSIFGVYEGCRNIITNEHTTVFMFSERKILNG